MGGPTRDAGPRRSQGEVNMSTTTEQTIGRHEIKVGGEAGFVFAGHATFTLQNAKTGVRITYKVTRAKDTRGEAERRPWFVSVLTGQNNVEDYTYLGTIFPVYGGEGGTELMAWDFRFSGKSRIQADAPSARGIVWLCGQLSHGFPVSAPMALFHEGTCSVCGRALTTPESIETGIGPVCLSRAG